MNHIRFWRTERRISQNELAAASGVPRWVIQVAEQIGSNISQIHKQKISSILGCGIEEIFPLENENKNRGNNENHNSRTSA